MQTTQHRGPETQENNSFIVPIAIGLFLGCFVGVLVGCGIADSQGELSVTEAPNGDGGISSVTMTGLKWIFGSAGVGAGMGMLSGLAYGLSKNGVTCSSALTWCTSWGAKFTTHTEATESTALVPYSSTIDRPEYA